MAENTKPSFGERIKKFFKDYKAEFKKICCRFTLYPAAAEADGFACAGKLPPFFAPKEPETVVGITNMPVIFFVYGGNGLIIGGLESFLLFGNEIAVVC